MPAIANSEERRTSPRADSSGSAVFDLQSHVINCTGVNLSEGGICSCGPWLARPGQNVGMKLRLFDREVRALGRIAWVRRERGQTVGGVEFTANLAHGDEVLKSYIPGMSHA